MTVENGDRRLALGRIPRRLRLLRCCLLLTLSAALAVALVVIPTGGRSVDAVGSESESRDMLPVGTPVQQPDCVITLRQADQDDQEGYHGCEDTVIDWWSRDVNSGHAGHLCIRQEGETSRSGKASLIRFGLTCLDERVPDTKGMEVLTATLRLYAYARTNMSPLDVSVHKLLREWHEYEATWERPKTDDAWYIEGCQGPGDMDPQALDLQQLNTIEKWYEWDVTEAVGIWRSDPGNNFGFILRGGAGEGVEYQFLSSEYTTEGRRPELVIKLYIPRPQARAPDVSLCSGYSQEDLEAEVENEGGGCTAGTCSIIDNDDETYTVHCDNQGYTATATGNVAVIQTPSAIAPHLSLCDGYSQADLVDAVLRAGGGCNPGTRSITDTQEGTYILHCSNLGCTALATGTITVNQVPRATAPDVTLCSHYSQADLVDAVLRAGGGCDFGECVITDTQYVTCTYYILSCDSLGCTATVTGTKSTGPCYGGIPLILKPQLACEDDYVKADDFDPGEDFEKWRQDPDGLIRQKPPDLECVTGTHAVFLRSGDCITQTVSQKLALPANPVSITVTVRYSCGGDSPVTLQVGLREAPTATSFWSEQLEDTEGDCTTRAVSLPADALETIGRMGGHVDLYLRMVGQSSGEARDTIASIDRVTLEACIWMETPWPKH